MKSRLQEQIHPEVAARLNTLVKATLQHWQLANAALPAAFPLVLFADTTLEDARALAGSLGTLRERATELGVTAGLAAGRAREMRGDLREWLRFYGNAIRGIAPGTMWERLLVPMPHAQCAPPLMLGAARDVALFWRNFEDAPPPGLPGPLTRRGGGGLADFQAAVKAFAAALDESLEAEIAADLARLDVIWTKEQLASLVLKYPAALQSRLNPGHRLFATQPRPWPQGGK